jgi:hypothetical protein
MVPKNDTVTRSSTTLILAPALLVFTDHKFAGMKVVFLVTQNPDLTKAFFTSVSCGFTVRA